MLDSHGTKIDKKYIPRFREGIREIKKEARLLVFRGNTKSEAGRFRR